ncbi:MAG: Ig-like domain-containing protein [Gemmatimonadaceae bacterium]|nr:Ig-like domain-containing protein [Gemmatimonadaceae bacterium]
MTRPSRRLVAALGLLAFGALSCGRDATGPNGTALGRSRFASLQFEAQFPTIPGTADALSDVVPFSEVRILLTELNAGDNTPRTIYDRTVPFPAGADSIELGATFPLPLSAPDSGILVTLHLAYINSQGDTVFRGGPTTVRARPVGAAGGDVPVGTPVVYTGIGASATSVELTPASGVAVAGTSTSFTAVARDGQGSIIANTPVFFSSGDTSRAAVADPAILSATWRPRRGPATVIATLLNGPADTATFDISLPASQVLVVSGDAQTALAGTALAQPLVLRVAASDSIGVAGVPVTFAVTLGGGSLGVLVDTSDANGLVSTTWTVGALGAQSIIATAVGIAGATRTMTATATAGAATRLELVTQPNDADAGAPITTSVRAVDALGNLVATFNGAVDVVVDSGPIEGWSLGGTDTVLAVAGVASFTTLTLDAASQYRFRFRATGLDSAVSAPFTINPGAAVLIYPIGGDAQAGLVSTLLANSIEVRVEDAFGNGVVGATVNWSPDGGSGSVSPTTSVTDNGGIARTAWTLGATVGVQTVSASSGALGPIDFTATGLAAVSGVRWLGSTSINWDAPLNWEGGVLPGIADTVVIPSGTLFSPRLFTSAVIGALVVENGATLDLDTLGLAVNGSIEVDVTGSIIAQPTGVLAMTGSGDLRGALPNVQLTGPTVTATGAITVSGLLSVGNGLFALNSQNAIVSGDFATTGSGRFQMAPGSILQVAGDVILAGGSTTGLLTGGELQLGGDFTQGGGSPSAFNPGANFIVQLNGIAAQSVTLLNSDAAPTLTCAASCFGTFVSSKSPGSGATQFNSSAKFLGGLTVNGDALNAPGYTLMVVGTPSLNATTVAVGAVGWRSGFTRSANFSADSLIAWGGGTLIESENIRTVVRGAYTAAATHAADLVVDAGGVLTINGTANVTGSFTSRGNGYVLMQQEADSLNIGGSATFDDDPPSGILTAGVMVIGGDFAQVGVDRGFLSEGTHRVRLVGNTVTVSFADAAVNRFQELFIDGTSSVAFTTPVSVTGSVTVASGVSVVSSSEEVSIGGDLVENSGGLWQVAFTTFTGPDPQLPPSILGNVTFIFGAVLDAPLTVNGDLAVNGGTLSLNGRRLDVNGSLRTTLAGSLSMTSPADTLFISGNAQFEGASTLNQLTAGHLAIGGNFTQTGTATSFHAVAPHETWLVGSATQTVSFATPGYGVADSHFGTLYLGQTGVQTTSLTSPIFVEGQLETGAIATSNHRVVSAGELIRAQGTDLDRLILENTRLRLDDGAALAALDTLIFESQNPGVVQFEIARSSGTANIARLEFQTVPTTGRYLRVVDLDGVTNGVVTVNISSVFPSSNGGFLQVVAPAVVNGWTNATFRWTGADGNSTWTNAGNWSDGVVPSVTDSVYIPPATLFGPVIPDGTTLRALVSDRTETPINMAGGLTITEQLLVPRSTGLACSAGTLNVSGGVTPVRMAGRVLCFTRMLAGTVDITDTLSIESSDLQVEGSAILQPGTSVVRVGNNFSTLGGGRLRMTSALGRLLVARGATFAGGGSATDLQAGRVEVGGNFSQSGGFTYAAAPAHVTYLFDIDSGFATTKQISFGEPVNSHFGTLEVDTWDRGVGTEIPVEGNFIGTGPVSMGGSGFLNVKGDVTVPSALASIQFHTMRVGGALTYAGDFGLDTVVFNGSTTQRVPRDVAYNFVRVTGNDVLMSANDGGFNIAGWLEVSGGLLRLGETDSLTTVVVNGDFRTVSGGRLQMSSTDTELSISGNALFAGGSTSGLLTNGTISVSGDFTQNTNPLAFVATGLQRTTIGGSVPRSIQFANAGPAQSRFSSVVFSSAAGQTVTLATAAHAEDAEVVTGNFAVAPNTGALTVTGNYSHSSGTTTTLGLNSSFSVGACSGLGSLLRNATLLLFNPGGCVFTIG